MLPCRSIGQMAKHEKWHKNHPVRCVFRGFAYVIVSFHPYERTPYSKYRDPFQRPAGRHRRKVTERRTILPLLRKFCFCHEKFFKIIGFHCARDFVTSAAVLAEATK